MELPRIISVDDHIMEPPNLWYDRLSSKDRDRGPRVQRVKGRVVNASHGHSDVVESDDDGASWTDLWLYENVRWPLTVGWVNVGALREKKLLSDVLITYDDILPGCYDQTARLADMDINHTDASMCFPNFSRFCGQLYLERTDRDLAFKCLQVYNNWLIDEWCGGAGRGRLIPNFVIPLWDPEMAAAEVRRCANKGAHAVAFSESPAALGLPSIHSGKWSPFFRACEETETVINMHVGSSSTLPVTSADAPYSVMPSLLFDNVLRSMVDWLLSGVLATHPTLRIAFSEGQVGWMPFVLERLDSIWSRGEMYDPDMRERIPEPPSSYVAGRVYGCVYDDMFGLRSRDAVGMSQIMFETDYPHNDSSFPDSRTVAEKLVQAAGLDDHEIWQFLRGNAIECYGLQRFGIEA